MLLFATTYLLTLPALFIILILGIIFEAYDNNFSIFLGLVAATVAFFMFDVPLVTIGIIAAAYLVIGVVWSFWRYKRYVDIQVDHIVSSRESVNMQALLLERINPKNMLGRITSWIIIWPFSMVENVTGDIIRLIKTLVSETLKAVYTKIFESATAKIPKPEQIVRGN